jgi:hypothetical protein
MPGFLIPPGYGLLFFLLNVRVNVYTVSISDLLTCLCASSGAYVGPFMQVLVL